MKKISFLSVFAITIFSFVNNSIAQQGWTQLHYGPDYQNNSVYFIDANTGWIAASNVIGESPSRGAIYKTIDGGNTWNSSMDNNISFRYVFFLNNMTGWAAGDKYNNSGGFVKYIYKSTDGGASWFEQFTELSNDRMVAVKFANASTGYALSKNKLYKSINGGDTWIPQSTESSNYNCLSVVSANCAAASTNNDSFTYTSDGGVMWNEYIYTDGNLLNCIFFLDANRGWIGDRTGKVLRSQSGPMGFQAHTNGFSNKNIFFANQYTGWGTNEFSTVSRTTNGGVNWSFQMLPYTNVHFSSIFFINSQTGWIVGSGTTQSGESISIRLKTTSSGLTSVYQISGEVPGKFSLSQNYPNPFNPSTKINYELPITNYVELKIYDALGNEVQTLVNEKQNAGSYSVDFSAAQLPSGIYFYKLVTEKYSETKKMILVK